MGTLTPEVNAGGVEEELEVEVELEDAEVGVVWGVTLVTRVHTLMTPVPTSTPKCCQWR